MAMAMTTTGTATIRSLRWVFFMLVSSYDRVA
jgi:hypothetical protein